MENLRPRGSEKLQDVIHELNRLKEERARGDISAEKYGEEFMALTREQTKQLIYLGLQNPRDTHPKDEPASDRENIF